MEPLVYSLFPRLIHYERNELNEAVAQFEIIVGGPLSLPNPERSPLFISAEPFLSGFGLPDQARKVAESISKLAFERGNKLFIDLSEAFQADLNLIQGRIAQADQWARAFVAPAPHAMQRFFNAELTSIRVMMARNTPRA